MDPVLNPYVPGAGTQPPELVGRDDVQETARIALTRAMLGRPSKNILMLGLPGMGKTVLLDKIRKDAKARGGYTLQIEALKDRSLPSILVPQLRLALQEISHVEAAVQVSQRALQVLAGFASAFKVNYQDIEVGLDFDQIPGLVNEGDLESDLSDLLEVVGSAAKAAESCVALFIDELEYAEETELAALITALHKTSQHGLPVIMIGTGLPQLRGRVGRAKPYAERLFEFPEIGHLSPEDAKRAIAKPAKDEGVEIEPLALDTIVSETHCYPYFLQEWGKYVWVVAERSPITASDVEIASRQAMTDLDENFFMVRFDRLTPMEKKYLRAMAQLGPEPHHSDDIAHVLNRTATSLSLTRSKLIDNGMIWSPSYEVSAFTVPRFDDFMLRIMPGDDWR